MAPSDPADASLLEPEYHVASFVVHCRETSADALAQRLDALEAVEVHARSGGKLVLTVEAASTKELADRAQQLTELPGVVQLAPVYHEFDSGPQQDLAMDPQSSRGK